MSFFTVDRVSATYGKTSVLRHADDLPRQAVLFPAGPAVDAFPAAPVQFADDLFADQSGPAGALHDNPCKLVPHDPPEVRPVALQDLPVGAADVGEKDPDQALPLPRDRNRHICAVFDTGAIIIQCLHSSC